MVKKVAPQNNDLLKYNDKNCIIMLNDDKVCIIVAV